MCAGACVMRRLGGDALLDIVALAESFATPRDKWCRGETAFPACPAVGGAPSAATLRSALERYTSRVLDAGVRLSKASLSQDPPSAGCFFGSSLLLCFVQE